VPMHEWTQPEIAEFLSRERLAYQRIELPFGLSTPGDARPEMCDAIFRDVAGKSVLDVGSYLGYFCQEALRRGAKSAHGIEADPEKVRQAHALAEMNGLAPSFTAADVEALALTEPYDVVLCLNVIHHLFDPIGTVLRLARAARHKLVLEVASLGPRDGRKLGLGFLTRRMIGSLPVLYAAPGNPLASKRTNAQKYFFTPESLRTILACHTHLFYDVEITPSGFKRRFVVIAKRRRIGHLLVVSGPTSVGKADFMQQLRSGALPAELRAKLPIGCEGWPQIREDDLSSPPAAAGDSPLQQPSLAGAVLHYDFLRPLASATHTFKRDQILDLLQSAERISVVTLRTQRERLIQRLRESEQRVAAKRSRLQQWHREQLLRDYESERWLESWYERWRSYLEAEHPRAAQVELRAPPASA